MTREEKRVYLIGECLSGAAHRRDDVAEGMAARAIEIADAVLDRIDAIEHVHDPEGRHDTIPVGPPRVLAHGPDDSGSWKPLPFFGEDAEEIEEAHGANGNGLHASPR